MIPDRKLNHIGLVWRICAPAAKEMPVETGNGFNGQVRKVCHHAGWRNLSLVQNRTASDKLRGFDNPVAQSPDLFDFNFHHIAIFYEYGRRALFANAAG